MQRITAKDVPNVDSKLIRSSSVARGIADAASDYDAVVIGATGQSHYQDILFGHIPERVARQTKCPVILVKRYQPVKALYRRLMGS